MRYTEEHAYGYAVQLWRDGDSMIGLFLASEGLQGDTPTGILENVKFNRARARCRSLRSSPPGSPFFPAACRSRREDLFEFSGTLKAGEIHVAAATFVDGGLTGTLKRSDPRQASRPVSREHVELKFRREADLFPSASYAEWKRQADEILKRRGPQW